MRTPFPRGSAIRCLAIALAAVVLAACGGMTSGSSEASDGNRGVAANGDHFDRCGLVTKDRASEVLGMPVATIKSEPVQCQYDDATGAGRLQVTLQIPPDGAAQTLANQRELLGPMTPIEGLGDEAFQTGPSTMPSIAVRKGKYVLNVMLYFVPHRDATQDEFDRMRKLAAEVIAKV
jgi:hypothetical protein